MSGQSTTKSLFPGLRIGYMILPPQLVTPMTVARTLARFIEGGHFGAHIRTMRAIYARRRDILASLVQQHLADFVEPRIPAGGMQMSCFFTRDIPEHEAVAAAYRAGIDLLGLTALYTSSQHRAGFLMGFAAHVSHELELAITKLARILQSLDRGITVSENGYLHDARHARQLIFNPRYQRHQFHHSGFVV